MAEAASPATAPSPDTLDEIDNDCAFKTATLRAALELGVIPAVAGGRPDLEGIAARINASVAGTRVLLAALCAIGLLEYSESRYRLSPTSAAYLDPSSPGYSGELYRADLSVWDGLTDAVRTGRRARTVEAGPAADRLWASYAAQALVDWPNAAPRYRARWEGLGITPSSVPRVRALDVCCGPALATLTLALLDPEATVLGIDRAGVVDIAARVAAAMGVASRASFRAGTIADLAVLDGTFDIVFFGHIFHFLTPDEIEAALRNAWPLLAPGGRIVINEVFATPGVFDDAYACAADAWLLIVSPQGRCYSVDELDAFLADAGFCAAQRLEGAPWLWAAKAP